MLVVAVALGLAAQVSHRGLWNLIFVAVIVLTLAFIGLSVAALRFRPATLLIHPGSPAFAALPDPGRIFSAAAFTLLGTAEVIEDIHDIVKGEDLWGLEVLTGGMWVLVVALFWWQAWGWWGASVRPGGVLDRQPFGSMFVPWEAFAEEFPAVPGGDNRIALQLRRPELVRRRGWRPGGRSLPVHGEEALLGQAIIEYVSRPEFRPAIGTEPELRRLTAAAVR